MTWRFWRPRQDIRCVFVGNDFIVAQLLADLLESHGIGTFVQGGQFGNIMAGRSLLTGAFRLLVSADTADAAADLVERWQRGEFALDDEDEDAAQSR